MAVRWNIRRQSPTLGNVDPVGSRQFVGLSADDPRRRRPDISRAARVLGWALQVGLREGLSRTLRWQHRQAAVAR
jgi:nucleoside-diphosphate-sugar epimerase